MRVRFMDRELGNAVIVQPPDGVAIVIDPAAPRARALGEFLAAGRLSEVLVLFTQLSGRSAFAVSELQKGVRVRRVIWVCQANRSRMWRSPLNRARIDPVVESLMEPGSEAKLSPSLRVRVLGGPHSLDFGQGSCVLKLSYRSRSLLYLADLTARGEAALISSRAPLQSSVLAVSSRARRDNPSIELLVRVRPEICVLCSNSPESGTMRRLEPENSGAALFRTDKDGIIEIVTNGRSVHSSAGGGL